MKYNGERKLAEVSNVDVGAKPTHMFVTPNVWHDLSRQAQATGGEILEIAATRKVTRPPPLVVLCDISGSMNRYAQILLHFLHAVANDRAPQALAQRYAATKLFTGGGSKP